MPPFTHFIRIITSGASGVSTIRTTYRFAVNPNFHQRLSPNDSPLLEEIISYKTSEFEEIHFDRSNLLLENGIRLRYSNDGWETASTIEPGKLVQLLKELGNVYIFKRHKSTATMLVPIWKNNPPQKPEDPNMPDLTITHILSRVLGSSRPQDGHKKAYAEFLSRLGYQEEPEKQRLAQIAKLTVKRSEWMVEGTKKVIVDETRFGDETQVRHVIGKVEMESNFREVEKGVEFGRRPKGKIRDFAKRERLDSDEEVWGKLRGFTKSWEELETDRKVLEWMTGIKLWKETQGCISSGSSFRTCYTVGPVTHVSHSSVTVVTSILAVTGSYFLNLYSLLLYPFFFHQNLHFRPSAILSACNFHYPTSQVATIYQISMLDLSDRRRLGLMTRNFLSA
ncbi:hypothetical protein K469DRAFT_681528 [Zopfia rhizophila CBS 207.26]|uniref:Uncharacterized protein n=1 Tax=Zopfia rhizophila CBS 207.26 TaxID=1314779 RepID=A0A6A6ESR1_9PEZI|nr:hypothetical protein K469DRAFT_681528 [Zopfia rhizophila CBS 207.26]